MPFLHSSHIIGKNEAFVMSTLDGSDTVYNIPFGAAYHSFKGAVSESRHVFIQNGLTQFSGKESVSILEIGFGTGLNAFLALLYSLKNSKKISYTGIEPFPLDFSLVKELNYPSYLAARDLGDIFLRMHIDNNFVESGFQFTRFETMREIPEKDVFDCIFFDAFSPEIQHELWEQSIFERLHALTSNDGCLVTYCAQGEVRRRLNRAGFEVFRIPGAPGKREMIRAKTGFASRR